MTMNAQQVATGTPRSPSIGYRGPYLLPGCVFHGDIIRNSANGATDTDEVTFASWRIPGGIEGLGIGAMFELWCGFDFTNSGNTKSFAVRLNGTNIGGSTYTTAGSAVFRLPLHVADLTTLAFLNNAGTAAGAGAATSTFNTVSVPALVDSGFTLALTGRWTTQPILSEFVRLKMFKAVFYPAN